MMSHKNAAPLIALAGLLAMLLACAAEPGATPPDSSSSARDSGDVREPIETDAGDLDLGEDWITEIETARGAARSTAATPGRRSSHWSIVLGTYSEMGHQTAAANMIRSASTIDPRLGSARVHTTSKGSMVVYGEYDGPDDPAARADLAWVKAIKLRERAVFPRAMLTRVHVDRARGRFRTNELLSVRLRFPDLHPLYTLQVAVWGDFESGKLTLEEIHGQAEAYVRELRANGYEAYFHHDDDLQLSTVTIGLFDHTAIDAASGIYAPELERLMRQFPVHLVNGEPLKELIDRRRPQLGTRVQSPRLMLVPQR
jgi:hypothetical protein